MFEKIKNNQFIHLITLLTLSIISHFPFVLKGIGEPDSARIAVIVIDRISHGPSGSLANYYFTDTIPLYIEYLILCLKIFDYDYSYLPAIMNYTNLFFSTLTVIPAYLLIRQLFKNVTVALCSVFALLFAPSFFQSSIYGAPHMIAFFFFITSLYFYIAWLDSPDKTVSYTMITLSSAALTLTMLFKSPIVLAGGIYLGLLYLRKVKDIKKIFVSFLFLLAALVFFLLIRQPMTGSSGGSTSSPADIISWFSHFFSMPSLGFFMRQIKPPFFGAGFLTSVMGVISLIYFLYKKRTDVLVFIVSWAALTNFFWMFVLGNNARHFMVSILPLLVIIVIFINEKTPRLTMVFTCILILGNYLIFPPSSSTYYPSGNIFKSRQLLQERNLQYHAKAKKIVNLDYDNIAVMGSFHTPYLVYEILTSAPSYEGVLLTTTERAIIRIKTDHKEYLIFYIASDNPKVNIEKALSLYDLNKYTIMSANYDLEWLKDRGMEVENIGLLNPQEIPKFSSIIKRH